MSPLSICHCEHLKGAWQSHTTHEIASADFASLAMTGGEPNNLGNYLSIQPNYKAPLKGLEPLHLAPEASALSSELQGHSLIEIVPHNDMLAQRSSLKGLTGLSPYHIITQF